MGNPLFDVSGKVVVVSGGSRGIGLMIARGFVEAGAKVYVSSRKKDVCDQVAAELSEVGEAISVPADLSTEEGCRGLAAEVAEREPAVHVLVNNAGATWGAPVADHDDAAWDRVLDLNVKGVFHLTRFLLPQLEAAATEDDPARVIMIGSIDGIQVPVMDTFSYSASKAAVHQLTRHLARRLAPRITVNAIAPGPFESKMMAATLEAFGDSIRAQAPMKRIGRPDDMAGTAIFLASRGASFITGAVLPVDGRDRDDEVSGLFSGDPSSTAPSIPAATVVLLRQPALGPPETLMLHKNRGQAFGGMWVFPGGRVEDSDEAVAGEGAEELEVARHAAVREAAEETGVVLPAAALVPFAHWIPPPEAPRRFSTWFFVAALPDGAADVIVDGGEIGDHVWTTAEGALARHAAGEIELAPPTWVSLRVLADHASPEDALAHAAARPVSYYTTRVADLDGDIVTMWQGDAGYESGDATAEGPRHRLEMARSGWRYFGSEPGAPT